MSMCMITRRFFAVSTLTQLERCLMFERCKTLQQTCSFREPNARFKHTDKQKNQFRTNDGKKKGTKKGKRYALPAAKVPEEIREKCDDRQALLELAPFLSEELTIQNYSTKFSVLLYLEQIQQEENYNNFAMKNAKFQYDGRVFHLFVPAVASGTLNAVYIDKVLVTHAKTKNSTPFLATVIQETRGHLQLKFDTEFCDEYDQDLPEWNIQFTFNRTSIRRCHAALKLVDALGTKVLFPEELHHSQPAQYTIGSNFEFFNQHLDDRQQMAVKQILLGESRPTPYIVFGPPGTGKSVTVVEAILQIFTKLPKSRILVCAPSNSAVDLLAQKLHQSGRVSQGIMARHFSEHRLDNIETVPVSVRPYCRAINDADLASKYRIIITTCNSAGALYALKLKQGHFSHVFIDEAGQATEPDSVIPFTLASNTDGQIVLSGDPHQLGPVVLSDAALTFGLNVSMLQRLMSLPVYSRNREKFSEFGSYNPLLVTKLVNNYRSHADILHTSSHLFYHGELLAEGTKHTTHSLVNWRDLPVQGVPLLFHSVKGTDKVGYDKPSRYNTEEAWVVVDYLQRLFNTIEDLKEEHIGIITPYSYQVDAIREMIAKRNLYKTIDIGTVEFFQGQERKIIIISTVRSNVEMDEPYQDLDVLGFLKNPQRLNVALTRAQALLIVIGNPNNLNENQYWRAFIDYCKNRGVFIPHDTRKRDRTFNVDIT